MQILLDFLSFFFFFVKNEDVCKYFFFLLNKYSTDVEFSGISV